MMPTEKPNVVLIMADDVGWFDVGAYHRGVMGTETPNIDRIAARCLVDAQGFGPS
jgi:arylsulfatase A-like enzyme